MRKGHPLTNNFRAQIRAFTALHKYELARQVGISPSTLSAWGVGSYSPILNDARALKLASLLGVSESDAFAATSGDGKPAPDAPPMTTTPASPLGGDGEAS